MKSLNTLLAEAESSAIDKNTEGIILDPKDINTKGWFQTFKVPVDNVEDFCGIRLWNGLFTAYNLKTYARYVSRLVQDEHDHTHILVQKFEDGNIVERYYYTKGSSRDATYVSETIKLCDGDESIKFEKNLDCNKGKDDQYVSFVTYCLGDSILLTDGYDINNASCDYIIKSGIPKYGAGNDLSKPSSYHTLYRVGGNINFITEYARYPHSENLIYIEGGCYQVFNRTLFETSVKRKYEVEPKMERAFRNLNFDTIKSAILYTGYSNVDGEVEHYILRVLKTKSGISVVYFAVNRFRKAIVVDNTFVLPCLASAEINSAEIESVIDALQIEHPDDEFIAIVINELNSFNKEVNSKSKREGKVPQIANSLISAMQLNKFSSDEIIARQDEIFKDARSQYEELTTYNIDATKN